MFFSIIAQMSVLDQFGSHEGFRSQLRVVIAFVVWNWILTIHSSQLMKKRKKYNSIEDNLKVYCFVAMCSYNWHCEQWTDEIITFASGANCAFHFGTNTNVYKQRIERCTEHTFKLKHIHTHTKTCYQVHTHTGQRHRLFTAFDQRS